MLFPEAKAAAEQLALEPDVSDRGFDLVDARARARDVGLARPRENVAAVLDLDADGVAVRAYLPAGRPDGVVLYLHGGGFVLGDVEVYDHIARRLANRTRRNVVSVDYSLAPEHPYPAALVEIDAVLQWLEREGDAVGLTGKLAAVGDGSGGNLALVAALRNIGRLSALALLYPMLEPTRRFDSRHTEKVGISPQALEWFWEQYCGADHARFDEPDLAPLASTELWTLPPTCIVTAEHDPMRGECEHLARLLAYQGVRVVASRFLGQINDFARHAAVFPSAAPALGQVADFVDSYL